VKMALLTKDILAIKFYVVLCFFIDATCFLLSYVELRVVLVVLSIVRKRC